MNRKSSNLPAVKASRGREDFLGQTASAQPRHERLGFQLSSAFTHVHTRSSPIPLLPGTIVVFEDSYINFVSDWTDYIPFYNVRILVKQLTRGTGKSLLRNHGQYNNLSTQRILILPE